MTIEESPPRLLKYAKVIGSPQALWLRRDASNVQGWTVTLDSPQRLMVAVRWLPTISEKTRRVAWC